MQVVEVEVPGAAVLDKGLLVVQAAAEQVELVLVQQLELLT
jgi:hypothetical protein